MNVVVATLRFCLSLLVSLVFKSKKIPRGGQSVAGVRQIRREH
jgi:hypothetical protein